MLNVYRNKYEIKSNKKYLIYYTGNFSPPHKGHIDNIKPYFNLKNVQILIHVWSNCEEKHNVPFHISIEILKIYLKGVENVHIEKFDHTYSKIFEYKIDTFVFIRGNENFYQIKKNYIDTYYDLIKKLRKKGVQSESLLIDRSSISSTEMCKNKNNISNYFPEYLLENDVKYILKILEKINLK